MLSQNPLIDTNPSDTIDNLSNWLEWLCITLSNDAEIHSGYVLSLKTALQAAKSLQDKDLKEVAGEKKPYTEGVSFFDL